MEEGERRGMKRGYREDGEKDGEGEIDRQIEREREEWKGGREEGKHKITPGADGAKGKRGA